MPKIIHFRESCIGCNSCVEHAESYWKMQEDGKAKLLRSKEKNGVHILPILEEEVEANLNAARDCPVCIIRILDDNGCEL